MPKIYVRLCHLPASGSKTVFGRLFCFAISKTMFSMNVMLIGLAFGVFCQVKWNRAVWAFYVSAQSHDRIKIQSDDAQQAHTIIFEMVIYLSRCLCLLKCSGMRRLGVFCFGDVTR